MTSHHRSLRVRPFAAVLATALLAAPLVRAASGGPDGFGYTWADSFEPGVVYAWEDISASGTDITVDGDDVNLGFDALSFAFPYYGGAYNQVASCSNGWLSPVDDVENDWTNTTLPNGGDCRGIIAAFWDDLELTLGTNRVLFQDFGTRAVFTWENVQLHRDLSVFNTFQAILYADGRIAVQYLDIRGDLASATMGIESPDEINGLTVFANTAGAPTSGYRVEFFPPVPLPLDLACGAAIPVVCGEHVDGDTRLGVANQDAYRCSRNDYSGREQIWELNVATPTDIRLLLTAGSGNPDIVAVASCDPNLCLVPPGDRVILSGFSGTLHVVIDSAPGQEGPYDLRIECYPLISELNCPGAIPMDCGQVYTGDTSTGAPNQDAYWCSEADFSGREVVYELNLAVPTDLRLSMQPLSGNPRLLLLNACDPNACILAPGTGGDLFGLQGTFHVVIDSAPGDEGQYRINLQCRPGPVDVDCAGATPIACGDMVAGHTNSGTAGQSQWWCSGLDHSGRERVYVMDLGPAPTDVSLDLTVLSGDPNLFVFYADPLSGLCEPGSCQFADEGLLVLNGLTDEVWIAIDSAPGDEGAYELGVECLTNSLPFCDEGYVDTAEFGNGSWLVNGWLYHPGDTHNFALRVDGDPLTAYDHEGFSCNPFDSTAMGVRMGTGTAFAQYVAPEGTLLTEMREASLGSCCGLLVTQTMTNTDVVPHFYEWRVYHDTAFGEHDATGGCTTRTVIDGGPIEVNGTRYFNEVELVGVGGTTCEGQIQMFSADHENEVRSSFQMLPPNLPQVMEYLDWNDGGDPCGTWSGLANGAPLAGCDNDNSLLMIWRFPEAAGSTLQPGESAIAQYRIGWRCAWPCNIACESPAMTTATAVDVGPCHDGIRVDWAPATFPGAGRGVYHVYRSTTNAADALAARPITPAGGVRGTSFVDLTTVPGNSYVYVVQAESTDFPDCGLGPAVRGSTAEATADPQLLTDLADLTPPDTIVGPALRATGHTFDTVDLDWTLAPLPAPDERSIVLRSDDDPRGPFIAQVTTAAQTWTDPAAPPRFDPPHVWFYDVQVVDACGNRSRDPDD